MAPQTPQRSSRPGKAVARLFLGGEIEEQGFGRLGGFDLETALVLDGGAIALFEALAVDEQRAARDLEPGDTPRLERMLDALAACQRRRVDGGVLVDRDRAIATVRRGDETEPAAALGVAERLLLVAGRDAGAGRLDPDLQQMDRLGLRCVVLAVGHAGARAHPLHV